MRSANFPMRHPLALAVQAAFFCGYANAADIDAQLAAGDAFKVTSQAGTVVRVRVNDNGSVVIPALPSAIAEEQFLCFDTASGQLGRCPAIPAGATGATGPIGPLGAVGATGATGSTGLQGPIGSTGSVGTTGSQGPIGATGLDGATGSTGLQGPIGVTGATGTQGTMGTMGSTGVTGPQGPVGPTGSVGATGSQGPIGATGVAGATGSTGSLGPIGATGAPGTIGATGSVGSTGSVGATGLQGSTGATGATGASGIDGATGATGVAGSGGVVGFVTVSGVGVSGIGGSPGGVNALTTFIGPTVNVVLAAGQRAHMLSNKALGSSATGGASELSIYACYQLFPAGALTRQGNGIFGLTVPTNQRQLYAINWVFSGLAAGTYTIGMCGSSSNAASWNNNEWGYISAMVF